MIAFVSLLLATFLIARAIARRATLTKRDVALHVIGALALVALAVATSGSPIVLAKIVARMLMPIGLVWSIAWLACTIAAARHELRRALVCAALGVALTLTG